MNKPIKWIRPRLCETGACAEVAFTGGRVLLRSSKRPHMIAVLDAAEWKQLRTGDFGEEL